MILTALPPFVRGSGSWSKTNEFPIIILLLCILEWETCST